MQDNQIKQFNETVNKPAIDVKSDRLIHFFQLCLDDHMRNGARMSSYIDFAQFKKQHQQFQDWIASRSDITYTMQIIPVEVPSNCQYYSDKEAMVLIISKVKNGST